MGGHVSLGSHAVVSGMTGIHQFTNVGAGVFIGGGLRVDRDVPPFSKALGEPLRWAGINDRALVRMGLDRSATAVYLKSVYRLLVREGISTFRERLEQLSLETPDVAMVRDILLAFMKSRKRGLLSFSRRR
jgi:UDP-N-acetylglucosamine acyltransferase